MTTTHPRPGHPEENLGEFAEELRLLAEAVLERVEPVLRRTASDGRTEWNSCSWCPVCAAAAIVRGEHHDVVAAIAEHGTAIVTVLREALAGVPVDPVIPPELDPDSPEYHAWHQYVHAAGNASEATDLPFADAYAAARGDNGADAEPGAGAQTGWRADESALGGHGPGPGAGLAAVFARFLAGAQGRAAARNQRGDNTFGGRSEGEDPLGRGPGAARSPSAEQSAASAKSDSTARSGATGQSSTAGQAGGAGQSNAAGQAAGAGQPGAAGRFRSARHLGGRDGRQTTAGAGRDHGD
ncbi:hypothetical protein, partial [Nocardia sp. NPDC004722]